MCDYQAKQQASEARAMQTPKELDAIKTRLARGYPYRGVEQRLMCWDTEHMLADLRALITALEQAERERDRMQEALAFYADLNRYYDEYGHTDLAAGDGGQRAREALDDVLYGKPTPPRAAVGSVHQPEEHTND